MKYNTKLQRKKIYNELLTRWIERTYQYGFLCGELSLIVDIVDIMKVQDIGVTYSALLKHFPELLAQKPHKLQDSTEPWFYGEYPRIHALKAAIKLCN